MTNVVTKHSNQEATTMIHTHQTAPTQFVEANGIRFAYRRFGKPGTIPLLFLEYFNSNMDGWDPDVKSTFIRDGRRQGKTHSLQIVILVKTGSVVRITHFQSTNIAS
jgi:hypothetical protein